MPRSRQLRFGSQTLPEGPAHSLFLAHLDSAGVLEWIKSVPSGSAALSAHALVKLPDALMVTGDFSKAFSFEDGTVLHSVAADQDPQDIYVARFGLDGGFQWAQSFGGESYDEVRDAIADHDGKLLATGWYHGPATFGSRVMYSVGYFNAPLLRIEP